MELDDLKHQWHQADEIQKPKNENLLQIIQNKSYGPLAALRRSFRRQMVVMVIVPAAIIVTNMQDIEKTLSSVLFWFYILFCIGVIIFAHLNYEVVRKMEGMDGMVKSNLEQQISLLQKKINQKLVGIRVALLLFILLTEILPYFQEFRMLNKWHALSPFIRFGAYGGLILLQYFLSRSVSRRKFGQHIDYLKEMVKQME